MQRRIAEEKIAEEKRRKERIAIGADAELPDYPNQYVCPITLAVMRNPVKAADGHTYERHAIVRALKEHARSPMTKEEMPDGITSLIPDRTLRSMIIEWPEQASVFTAASRRSHPHSCLPPSFSHSLCLVPCSRLVGRSMLA